MAVTHGEGTAEQVFGDRVLISGFAAVHTGSSRLTSLEEEYEIVIAGRALPCSSGTGLRARNGFLVTGRGNLLLGKVRARRGAAQSRRRSCLSAAIHGHRIEAGPPGSPTPPTDMSQAATPACPQRQASLVASKRWLGQRRYCRLARSVLPLPPPKRRCKVGCGACCARRMWSWIVAGICV